MSLKVFDLGLVPFKQVRDFQSEIFQSVKQKDFSFGLIFCRHKPVITIGRTGSLKNILVDDSSRQVKGIEFYSIERGGDVTYHGPGQLMVYPIFDLHYLKKDINLFLRSLEQVIVDLLADFGIKGEKIKGLTGVWVDVEGKKQKIASIGIAVKNWITFHGLALNVKKEDLANFSLIRPCGLDIKMTYLESLTGRQIDIDDIRKRITKKFKEALDDQSCFTGVR